MDGEAASADNHAFVPGYLLRVVRLLVNPIRFLVYGLAVSLFMLGCAIYEYTIVVWPSMISPTYRRRHHHRLWNSLIAFWGRNLMRLARVILGVRLVVDGEVPPGCHLVVSNHQSLLDIPALFTALEGMNVKFTAKKSLLRWLPNVSSALRDGGFGVVDFSSPGRTLRGFVEFCRGLPEWEGSPAIFPEGIRTFDGSVSPFHRSGLAMLLRQTGLPVLPVAIDGLWHVRTFGKMITHLPGSVCRVSVLPPVPAEEARRRSETIHEELESLIRDELERMRGETGSGARRDAGD